MEALILDGKSLAAKSEQEFVGRVKKIVKRNNGLKPVLATILVGNDPASTTYVRMKGDACSRVGLDSLRVQLGKETTTEELMIEIDKLNKNSRVQGILLQHPVPPQINEKSCFDMIDVQKDVDGVTSLGFGMMAMGLPAYGSATPGGIMRLLTHYGIDCAGKHAVVVGRSPILGKPMAMMLLNANATVTICHSKTGNLREEIGRAEILVGAVGKPEYIKSAWIKDQAIVVDAGYHPGGIGDIQIDLKKCNINAYTPVPGGVGPMTINTLILQTIEAAERSKIGDE
ncbi:MAG: tetrahydrofolate dehydrogenase/cyclohydrolase catalytic domain-containing protein [Pseudomonadota bacterium]|nr:tetrahydrofolate dehydrogenase/cyclohydrolase catalytic domain-containing protein [Pseudomonadota bacterium]